MAKQIVKSNKEAIEPAIIEQAAIEQANEQAIAKAATPDVSQLMDIIGALQGQIAALSAKPAAIEPTKPASAYEARPDAYKNAKGVPLEKTIVWVAANPKKPGSAAYARYARYPATPFTLAECLKVPGGPNTADFLYDIRKGFIKEA